MNSTMNTSDWHNLRHTWFISIVTLYKHAGIFNNLSKVPREARAIVFLKISMCLYSQDCTRNKLISFIKCPGHLHESSN